MRAIACVAFLLLAACATESGFREVADSWLGSTEQELVATWGPPDQVYESGGNKYLTYLDTGSVYVPGTSPTYSTTFVGNTAYTTSYGGTPARTYAMSCKVTFAIANSRITSYRYEGNACRA